MQETLRTFFAGIYGAPESGRPLYMGFAASRGEGSPFEEMYFPFPDGIDEAISWIERRKATHNVYFCVSLLSSMKRKSEFAARTHCVWVDFDECTPDQALVDPTMTVETSPGRYQCYWVLADPLAPAAAEELSRRVAYKHKGAGADPCWDRARLMRIPGTVNLKYPASAGDYPNVKLISAGAWTYEIDDFDQVYEPVAAAPAGRSSAFELNYALVEGLGAGKDVLAKFARELSSDAFERFYTTPQDSTSWSHVLWALEMCCFEAGMSREETFVVARDSACNKFGRDGRPDGHLWQDVCKAFAAYEEKLGVVFSSGDAEEIEILSPAELDQARSRTTFIERYMAWAKTRTDSPPAFHQGGALMALSATLADLVHVPVQYGNVKTNLWVLLMADTTISRKSTAMNLATGIIGAVNPDALLATDGSVEGLLGGLAARSGKPSIYKRDEFTGFMNSVAKKDYMGDTIAYFCQLYDGTPVKRVLRKETFTIDDPNFLLYAAGVRSKLFEQFTQEHVINGFLPRFIPIFGTTEIADLDLIGPPKSHDSDRRNELIEELTQLRDFYSAKKAPLIRLHQTGDTITTGKQAVWRAELTPAAWDRIRQFQGYMLGIAAEHQHKEFLLPCVERLVTNVLKCAALVAAAEKRGSTVVAVELTDIIHVLYYARGWLDNLLLAMNLIGINPFEGQLSRIVEFVNNKPGVSRSSIMSHFKMSARDATEIFRTLEERHLIVGTRTKNGGTQYNPPQRIKIVRPTTDRSTS